VKTQGRYVTPDKSAATGRKRRQVVVTATPDWVARDLVMRIRNATYSADLHWLTRILVGYLDRLARAEKKNRKEDVQDGRD